MISRCFQSNWIVSIVTSNVLKFRMELFSKSSVTLGWSPGEHCAYTHCKQFTLDFISGLEVCAPSLKYVFGNNSWFSYSLIAKTRQKSLKLQSFFIHVFFSFFLSDKDVIFLNKINKCFCVTFDWFYSLK